MQALSLAPQGSKDFKIKITQSDNSLVPIVEYRGLPIDIYDWSTDFLKLVLVSLYEPRVSVEMCWKRPGATTSENAYWLCLAGNEKETPIATVYISQRFLLEYEDGCLQHHSNRHSLELVGMICRFNPSLGCKLSFNLQIEWQRNIVQKYLDLDYSPACLEFAAEINRRFELN